MKKNLGRKISNFIFTISCWICIFIAVVILFIVLYSLISKGLPGINLKLFTENLPPLGSDGGLLNAIKGSFIITGIAILIAMPIGILAATYLTEFNSAGKLNSMVRFVNDTLLSAPSIIIGLFVYGLVVKTLGHFSALAGIIALIIIAVPMIMRTSEDVMKIVPYTLREAAVSLGIPRWKVTFSIIYKSAASGLITGVILALARIAGETAPLLFTVLNNQFSNDNLLHPMANLPVVMFQYAMSPYENSQELAWSAALIITVVILFLNIFARVFCQRKIN